MKKPSTKTVRRMGRQQDQQLTIGLDLGDRSSFYCVLNGAGEVIVEEKVATSPEAMKKTFGKMPRSRIALETGTHSPWVSRLLSELGHEVIVANARNVRLIGESRKKDDRLDARTLARLARIDPQLLAPVKHRSAQAQADLTVIRARAVLVHRPDNALYYCGFQLELIHAESRSRCLAESHCESRAGPTGAVAVHAAESGATKPDCFGGRCGQNQPANRRRTAAAGSDGKQMAPQLCQQGIGGH